MKKIGVIGTRKRNIITDFHCVKDKFFEVYNEGDWIVSGHCPKGGDAFAEKIAYDYGIPILLFPPKKKTRKEFYARNILVANECDIIVACVINPHEGVLEVLQRKSGGSEHTLRTFADRMYCMYRDPHYEDYIQERIYLC